MDLGVSRNLVVQAWGTPAQTAGSLNEPREREEGGIVFNEKWVYAHPKGEREVKRRIIYWRRYDCVGSYIERRDGSRVREDLATVLGAGLKDRRYRSARVDSTQP